jgi:hypothetical protein
MTAPKKATFIQTMKAVLWSFFGVRKGADHDADMARLNPIHVIIAGLIAAAVFIFTLIAIVQQVVS